jgi:DNA-directed RNA polymerase subunit H (RpoH/RPB5)
MNLAIVEYTIKEKHQIIFENALKMLWRRNLISNYKSILDKTSEITSNKEIKIKLDDGSFASIYIVNGKVSSISNNSPIDDYLKDTNILKILVIEEPSKRVFKQVIEDYPNTNIFFFHEFMEDIPSKNIIPQHILLTEEEKNELLVNFKNKNLKKIFTTDMMSRYFDAKVDDIFRIERLNITSGKGVDYRVVIQGKLDLLF